MSVTFDQKKIIKYRIEQIKNKNCLIEIYEIIKRDNSINITENNNGMFMHFNNLKNETYLNLEKYLNNVEKIIKNKNDISSNLSELNSNISENNSDIMSIGSKLKLSNKEKNIIKKKQYDKIMSEESECFKDIVYTKFETI